MPCLYIAREIPHRETDSRRWVIHEIPIPSIGEPGFYRAVVSLDSFSSGKRAGVSTPERACFRTSPAWAPGRLYRLLRIEEWEEEVARITDSMRKHLHDWPDERELPRVRHASIWDFYAHIGWDRKRRRYVDKNGQPIKYSAV